MSRRQSDEYFDQDAILRDILRILRGMTSDWEMGFAGAIGPTTYLAADLAFESIHLVQLVIALEEHFQRRELPFQQLFMPADGRGDDLQVAELANFLHRHLNNP